MEIQNTIIRLKDVAKIYEVGSNRVHALNGVSLDIRKGEFCCIVGRSGSGKSTLLNMMAGLEKPTHGSIYIDGKQIDRMNEAKLVDFRLNHLGFVFQSFNLFPMHTALDNVAMPLMYKGVDKTTRLRRAQHMIEAVGLKSHMKHKPSQMSGGQQQRVGIARALVTKPQILFADEPTGNLDVNTSREILKLIRDICAEHGATLIMVTHDPEIGKFADRVVTIQDGKVLSDMVNEHPEEIVIQQTTEETKNV